LPFGRCRQSGCFELDMDRRQPLTTTTTQGLRGQVVEMEPPTEEYQPYENGQHCNVDVGHVWWSQRFLSTPSKSQMLKQSR
jgi:hypothetical protein